MTDKFEIGEVAIYVRPGSSYQGTEVTVITALREHKGGFDHVTNQWVHLDELVHTIRFHDGIRKAAKSEWLKKKQRRLDRECDRKVSWDECLWKPKQVTA